MSEPDNLVLTILRDMRGDMAEIRSEMATKADVAGVKSELKNDIADLRSELRTLRADIASDFIEADKRMSHLNRAIVQYHSTAVGHGLLYSDIDDRLRRVEQHLKLSPLEPNVI